MLKINTFLNLINAFLGMLLFFPTVSFAIETDIPCVTTERVSKNISERIESYTVRIPECIVRIPERPYDTPGTKPSNTATTQPTINLPIDSKSLLIKTFTGLSLDTSETQSSNSATTQSTSNLSIDSGSLLTVRGVAADH